MYDWLKRHAWFVALLLAAGGLLVPFIVLEMEEQRISLASSAEVNPNANESQVDQQSTKAEPVSSAQLSDIDGPQQADKLRLAYAECISNGADDIRSTYALLKSGVLYCWDWLEQPYRSPSDLLVEDGYSAPGSHLVRATLVTPDEDQILFEQNCPATMDSDVFNEGVGDGGKSFDLGAEAAILGCRTYSSNNRYYSQELNIGERFDITVKTANSLFKLALWCECSGFHAIRIDQASFDATMNRLALKGTTLATNLRLDDQIIPLNKPSGTEQRSAFELEVLFDQAGRPSLVEQP
jgi:hypothetical protein